MLKLHRAVAAGFKGINSDLDPWNLSAEFITDGQNFRIEADKIKSTGAEEEWSQLQVQGYSWYWFDNSGAPPNGFLLYNSGQPNKIKVAKVAQASKDASAVLALLKVGDQIVCSAYTRTITGITDNGTYYTFDTVEDGSIGGGAVYATYFPDRVDKYFGHLMPVDVPSGEFWIAAGRDDVWVYDGNEDPVIGWSDISSAAGYTGVGIDGEYDWTSCMLGTIPLLNNPGEYPEYWSPQSTSQVLQRLMFDVGTATDFATQGVKAKVIRSFKNYVFLLNLTEGATDLPTSYRWSHPADDNGLPATFDETKVGYIAGKDSVGGDGGSLIDGRALRDTFMLYQESAITVLEESFDEFVFRERKLSSSIGVLNKDSIVEVKGIHYFISDGDIYRNDGNSVISILENRLKDRFNSQAKGDYFSRSYAMVNVALKEIWFCIPEGSATHPDTAYVYNWFDQSWAIQKIPGTVVSSDYGSQVSPPDTFDSFEGTGVTFDDMTGVAFDSQNRTPLNKTVVGLANTNTLQILDPNITQSTDLDSHIERIGYPIDDMRQVNKIVRLYPHILGTKDVSIQVGGQDFPGAPIKWKSAKTFNPETDRRVNVRVTTPLLCWRISSIGTGMFSYSGMDIEYSPSGRR